VGSSANQSFTLIAFGPHTLFATHVPSLFSIIDPPFINPFYYTY